MAALTALMAELKASPHLAESLGQGGLVEGWYLLGFTAETRLPGLDLGVGPIARRGQTAVATVVFTLAAPVRGSQQKAVCDLLDIERGLWRTLHSKLTGEAAKLFRGTGLRYRGMTVPPGPLEDRDKEFAVPVLVARCEAEFPYNEHAD